MQAHEHAIEREPSQKTQSANPVDVVERYLAALSERDFQAARHCLCDQDFSYCSPIATFDDAERFITSMHAVGAILHRIEVRHRFAVENDVCHILEVTVAMDGYKSQSVAHLARVLDGKIARLEAIFDGSDYRRMIEESIHDDGNPGGDR